MFNDSTVFTAADDSSDVNAPLDLKQINKIVFLDITGLIIGDNEANTLWINKLQTNK